MVFEPDPAADAALLDGSPDFLCITDMLKATPRMESGQRVVYLEASNEALDAQNEVVLAKALGDSAPYFLKFGNLDIDHYTVIGARLGIPDYPSYEIGRPADVKVQGNRVFVKGLIQSGAGKMAEKANMFWQSLTEVDPPQRWYPSVGGKIMDKGVEFDPKTLARRVVIKATRWFNIGFSKTPVNANVPTVATMPMGAFAKAWGMGGLDLVKALTAGYGTDAAQLTGGSAFRVQSLDGAPVDYFDLRDRLAGDLSSKRAGANPGAADLVAFASKEYGLGDDQASAFVERFMRDLRRGLKKPPIH